MTITCVCFWYARQDSNLRPTALKPFGFCKVGVNIDFGMEWGNPGPLQRDSTFWPLNRRDQNFL